MTVSTATETPKAQCLCDDCHRPMRPRGVLLKEMPGTMAWGHSGKCKSCVQPNGPTDRNKAVPAAEPVAVVEATPVEVPIVPEGRKDLHLEHTISGLNSFLAARERRLRIQAAKTAAQLPLRRTA